MRTIDLLSGTSGALFWPGVIAAIAVALLGGMLSLFVVLKRMAFVGQGVTHAAFGGIGLASLLGLSAAGAPMGPGAWILLTTVCLAAALGIAALSQHRHAPDTAIGIVLVAAMAAGAIFNHLAARLGLAPPPAWEGLLFGSLTALAPSDAYIAWATALAVAIALWLVRRPMVFWAFDEPAAYAFGVRTHLMQSTLLILLALAIVVSMKLAGVVLTTAVLVLPGVTALRLTTRLRPAVATSIIAAILGIVAGLILSFEADWPTGAAIVASMIALLALVSVLDSLRARLAAQ